MRGKWIVPLAQEFKHNWTQRSRELGAVFGRNQISNHEFTRIQRITRMRTYSFVQFVTYV